MTLVCSRCGKDLGRRRQQYERVFCRECATQTRKEHFTAQHLWVAAADLRRRRRVIHDLAILRKAKDVLATYKRLGIEEMSLSELRSAIMLAPTGRERASRDNSLMRRAASQAGWVYSFHGRGRGIFRMDALMAT